MTLDEAIIHCEEVADTPYYTDKEPKCYSEHRQLAEWLKDYKRLLEQQPCTDAISRQAAIDAIWDGINMDIYTREVKECLEALPSVTPQPRIGTWIKNEWGNISCSSCGCAALYDKVYPGESVFGKAIRVKSTFCPTCGAKMQEVEE